VKLFGTTGQKFHHCPGTKGQAKNLSKGQDGPGQRKSGTGRGTKRDRTEKDILKQEKDVLKQENDVLKQEIWSFF
jgi:hypothetical protein